MNRAYYGGDYRDGKPHIWFFDGLDTHDLVERCRLQGLVIDAAPDWLLGEAEAFTLSRMILTDAGGGVDYVNDMDRHFALAMTPGVGRKSWRISLETVHAWMVVYEPLRRHLRTLFGRDCPSCG